MRITTGYLSLALQPGRLSSFSLAVHLPEPLRRFLSSFTQPLLTVLA